MTLAWTGASSVVRSRLDRATPRERALLVALAAAGLVALPFPVHDWAGRREADAAASASRLQALRTADDGAGLRGPERRTAELEARVAGWSPPASSFATARVLAEQEAAAAAAAAGAAGLEVRAADTPDRVGPARFVRVELSCAFTWSTLVGIVRRLAGSRPGVVVERASTDGAGADARLNLTLLLPFREAAAR